MDLRDRTAMILGGSGLVGHAVARRLLATAPRRLVLVALFEDEVRATARALEPYRGRATIDVEWGNVFLPASLAQLERGAVVANPEQRRLVLQDLLGELTDDVLQRSFLYQLLLKYKPDAVVDSINTATAFAYQDPIESAQQLLALATEGKVDRAAVERHVLLLTLPQLIRHVQILVEALRRAETTGYVKIGTSGTGGMGFNIPYTHSEERPSRPLLMKSAVAGAQSLLLFLLGRTPGAPATVEIKPTATIAWREIGYGPIRRKGKPIPLVDCPEPVPVGEAFQPGVKPWCDLGKPLEGVYIDVGENGLFSSDEFETVTALGQMEFITPEEVAEYVAMELEGRPTGRDIVAALDGATAGPTYRAGVLRAHALDRLHELERQSHTRTVATRGRRRRAAGWTSVPPSSGCGSNAPGRCSPRPSGSGAGRRIRGATSTGRRSAPTTRSSPRASRRGCSVTRTEESASSADTMALDTAGVDRALGAVGTTFRLTRLYPPTHPAVMEALRQIGDALPPLAALGTVEWKIGATGLHWHGQHLLPRNMQIAELAGLLYARGIRAITLNPGMTADHVLALFGVAMGTILPDDTALGRITLTLGRRSSQRLERLRAPTPPGNVPAVPVAAPPPSSPSPSAAASVPPVPAGSVVSAPPLPPSPVPAAPDAAGRRTGVVFRPDVVPADVEAKRAVASLGSAATLEEQRAAVDKLHGLAPQLLGLHNAGPVPPASVAPAVGRRPPYRAASRRGADRALEPLQGHLADSNPAIAAAAAEFVGLTGSPQAVALLLPLVHHDSEFVREAALIGLAEAGGREISRPAMPALKDEGVSVRLAAARAIAAGGGRGPRDPLVPRAGAGPAARGMAEVRAAVGR